MEHTQSHHPNQHTKPQNSKVIKISKRHAIIGASILAIVLIGFVAVKMSVVAIVNGIPVSRWSIIRELEQKAGSQLLQQRITEKLLDSKIRKANISVSAADIDSELQKITEQVSKQGGTLDQALSQQRMTVSDLRDQILKQKQLEKLLEDKVSVSDAEIEAYVKDTKATAHEGETMEEFKKETAEQLKQKKLQIEAQAFMESLLKDANITYITKYK